MDSTNLVAFGCSYTFGTGYSGPDFLFKPYEHAWPSRLAEKLSKRCINLSRPGASNIEILNKILTYNFRSSDTIVIMWSFFERDMIFLSPTDSFRIYGNIDAMRGHEGMLRSWAHLHTDYDIRYRNWIYIYHAWLHLINLNAEFYFSMAPNISYDEIFLEIRPNWANAIKFQLIDTDMMSQTYGYADDKRHPGRETHEQIAIRLLDSINNRRQGNESVQ